MLIGTRPMVSGVPALAVNVCDSHEPAAVVFANKCSSATRPGSTVCTDVPAQSVTVNEFAPLL